MIHKDETPRRSRIGRRVAIGAFLFVALTGAAALVVWYRISRVGTSAIEQWIGQSLVGLVDTYINPTLRWSELDYQAPMTVAVTGLSLTQDSTTLLQVDRTMLELAERPQIGESLSFRKIRFDKPRVSLISTEEKGLVGWSDFLKPTDRRKEMLPREHRLSDSLRMEELTIFGGELRFVPADDGGEMNFGGIDARLDTKKHSDNPDVYKLSGNLSRIGLAEILIDGHIDLNTGLLELAALQVKMEMDESRYGQFPPAVRDLLAEHEVRGSIDGRINGRVELARIRESAIRYALKLNNGRMIVRDSAIEVPLADVTGEYDQSGVNATFKVDALDGTIEGAVEQSFVNEKQLEAEARFNQISLKSLLALVPAKYRDEVPTMSGSLSGMARASLAEGDWANAAGEMQLQVPQLQVAPLASPIEGFNATARLAGQRLDVSCSADVFGGMVKADGEVALDDRESVQGIVRLKGIDVGPAAKGIGPVLPMVAALANLSGNLDGDFSWTYAPSSRTFLLDAGQLQFRDLAAHVANTALRFDTLNVVLLQSAPEVELKFDGNAFGGAIHGVARIPAQSNGSAHIELQINNCELAQVARLIPVIGDHFSSSDAQCRLNGTAVVSIPMDQPAAVEVALDLSSNRSRIRGLNDQTIEVRDLLVKGTVAPAAYHLDFEGRLLEGRLSGRLSRDGSEAVALTIQLDDIDMIKLTDAAGYQPQSTSFHGRISGHVTAALNPDDTAASRADADLRIRDGECQTEKLVFPFDDLQVKARLDRRQIKAEFEGRVLTGELRGNGSLGLDGARPISLRWNVSNGALREIRDRRPDRKAVSGRINSSGELAGELDRWPGSMHGSGRITVEDARLISIPIFSEIVEQAQAAVAKVPFLPEQSKDSGEFEFTFRHDRLTFDRFDIQSAMIAARGRGDIFYDRSIALTLNAGPVEKIQSLLGRPGKLIGRLTDQLYSLRASGTLDQPRVELRPGFELP